MLRPSSHRKRNRLLATAALAVMAVSASVTAPAVAAPAGGKATSKVSRPTTSRDTAASLWGMTFTLPTGWTASGGGTAPTGCLRSATTSMDVCGIDVYKNADPDPYPERADGDFSGTPLAALNLSSDRDWAIGQPSCRIPGTTDPTPPPASQLVRQDLITLADGRRADQREWQVTCAGGATFTVGAWYLPVSNILFYSGYIPQGEWNTYAGVIASMDLTSYQG